MRVCTAHKIQAVETFKCRSDDAEYDLCPECLEAVNLIFNGAFFESPPKEIPKRGRPPKEATP